MVYQVYCGRGARGFSFSFRMRPLATSFLSIAGFLLLSYGLLTTSARLPSGLEMIIGSVLSIARRPQQ